MAKVKLPPQAREAAARASKKQPTSSSQPAKEGSGRRAGVKSTLLKQRSDAANSMQREMSEKERAERNRRFAKKEAKKRLESAFGQA
eukprot:2055052-Amphidinium_carterae.1